MRIVWCAGPCAAFFGVVVTVGEATEGPRAVGIAYRSIASTEGQPAVPEEAKTAWGEFRKNFQISRLVFSSQLRTSRTAEPRSTEVVVKCYNGNYLMVWDEEARCINDKYGFHLKRSARDRPWTLTSLALRIPRELGLEELQKWVSLQQTQASLYPLAVYTELVNDLVGHSGFRATSVESRDSRASLVDITFQIADPRAVLNNGPISFQSGRLTLDPEHSWLPVRQELEWPGGTVMIFELMDFSEEHGVSYPRKTRACVREKNGSEWEYGGMSVQEVHFGGPVPDRDFTLSAFGLPEPARLHRRLPAYVWFGAAALMLLALGAWLRRRTRPVSQ